MNKQWEFLFALKFICCMNDFISHKHIKKKQEGNFNSFEILKWTSQNTLAYSSTIIATISTLFIVVCY